ncbi:NAD(P)/FAD-dependent oxidoreductase [Arthrobacter sp. YAF34]|uniref:NAD(P)/FAD-dependent oxidoreductase n=1 Tax=Arthrobacter sp. YAF34 TaxID=3233083 RepID=UPI003F93CC4F
MTTEPSPARRYRNRSLWLDQLDEPLTPRPSLAGDTTTDVAIVGAGMTGLWTAYYLAVHQPDLRIVVLEREIAGFGASGRNGGWVGAGIAGSAGVYARRHGQDAVRRAILETCTTVDEIGRVIAEEGIDCGYVKAGSLAVATSAPQKHRMLQGIDAAVRAGTLCPGDRAVGRTESERLVHVEGWESALYTPHCAGMDPARFIRGLARACEARGVVIYEGTEVTDVAPGLVRSHHGSVKTDAVIRATEAYTIQLPGQSRSYLPLTSLMIATEPLSAEVWEELGWTRGLTVRDLMHLFFYAQRTPDDRIAIGGRGAPYALRHPIDERRERDAGVRARLIATLHAAFPAVRDAAITHHWGGPLGVPRDWSMGINFDQRTGFGTAGGYSGHGVTAANISGRTLADLLLRRNTDLTRLPWVGHRSRNWEPEPLRFLASSAIVKVLSSADHYEERTQRNARSTSLLAPVMPPP